MASLREKGQKINVLFSKVPGRSCKRPPQKHDVSIMLQNVFFKKNNDCTTKNNKVGQISYRHFYGYPLSAFNDNNDNGKMP